MTPVILEFSDWDLAVIAALRRLHDYGKAAKYLSRKMGKPVTSGSLRTTTYRLRLTRLLVGQYLREYESLRKSLGPGVNYLSERKRPERKRSR